MTLLLTFAIVYKAGAQEQSRSLTLDLDKAIEIALSENPTIKVADIEITRKDYSRKGGYRKLISYDYGIRRLFSNIEKTSYVYGHGYSGNG